MPYSFGSIKHAAAIVIFAVLLAPHKPLIFAPYPAARMRHYNFVLKISATAIFCCHDHFNKNTVICSSLLNCHISYDTLRPHLVSWLHACIWSSIMFMLALNQEESSCRVSFPARCSTLRHLYRFDMLTFATELKP